jgi:hypothetical protein
MARALNDAWGACDAIANESMAMRGTRIEDMEEPFSMHMANHMEQGFGLDGGEENIGIA